ncbi:gluconokinase [uncultured Methylobacterium sp.]|uniref:gluconokinase n=1 Tax=uncultured Methylobacterium sp. TaxID=157278 RepID=UPI0035CC48D1
MADELSPTVLVVMGVSGSGKSTVAALLAERLGWDFADGDTFHGPGNIAKMQAGIGLGDGDRTPWLAAIAAWIDRHLAEGRSGVIVCSALKRSYRGALVRDRPAVRIVYLSGEPALIAERLSRRLGHFMPATLLESQFAALEPPGPEERPITVSVAHGPTLVVEAILDQLGYAA